MRSIAVAVLVALALMSACGDDPYGSSDDSTASGAREYEASVTVLESPDHGPELCTVVADSLPPQCGGIPVRGWEWSSVEAESVNGTTWGDYHVVGTFDGEALTLTQPPSEPRPNTAKERVYTPGCGEPDVIDASHGHAEFDTATAQSETGVPGSVGAWISRPEAGGDGTFSATVVVESGRADEASAYLRQRYGGPLCVIERDITQADIDRIQQELHDAEATASLRSMSSAYDLVDGVFEVEVWLADDDAKAYARDRWGDLVELTGILQPVT